MVIYCRLGIKHVKGMLLYGPLGTGKTLMARQIGKLLNGREPKVCPYQSVIICMEIGFLSRVVFL